MNIINQQQFRDIKTSDTLVVLGSGTSINEITGEQWKRIDGMNSIGFNWFCHHKFGPTFFVIREQANNKKRNVDTETRKHLFADMSKSSYKKTCLIVHDVSRHSKRAYSYVDNVKRFSQNGIIVKDVKKRRIRRTFFTMNIFTDGVFHGNTTLVNVIHIGLFLKYKRIIFAGVDLRHSKYFWLGNKRVRSNIRTAGGKNKSRHPAASRTISLLKMIKREFKVSMFSANKKSYLVKIMPYLEI